MDGRRMFPTFLCVWIIYLFLSRFYFISRPSKRNAYRCERIIREYSVASPTQRVCLCDKQNEDARADSANAKYANNILMSKWRPSKFEFNFEDFLVKLLSSHHSKCDTHIETKMRKCVHINILDENDKWQTEFSGDELSSTDLAFKTTQ